MCGFVGFWDAQTRGTEQRTRDLKIVERMSTLIRHRGPDGEGLWRDDSAGLSFAHRRLSILDLSTAGAQPMRSACGRYVLCYNGEVYNHRSIRAEIDATGQAPVWLGHSDTETLLAGIAIWGLRATLERANGMFAFALWDRSSGTLSLARDRMGEKPLYYGISGGVLLFGSELKALRAHPAFSNEIDRDALAQFLKVSYVPAPKSIYRDIRKLPPAHFIEVLSATIPLPAPRPFWSLGAATRVARQDWEATPKQAIAALDTQLQAAVTSRMEADVSLGAFLSGGYDSSTVVAYMQAARDLPIDTFSIGFNEQHYNEAHHAKAVAAHLGTHHIEHYVTAQEALDVVARLPQIYDEPFADASQIPTFLVSQLAKQQVTVTLSGDGGDELFCGYNRHTIGIDLFRKLSRLPRSARAGLSTMLRNTPPEALEMLQCILPPGRRTQNISERLPKLIRVLDCVDGLDFYAKTVSKLRAPEEFLVGQGLNGDTVGAIDMEAFVALKDLREQMMFLDMQTYLPDDILAKVDRASMAVSLEARVPFLDHRLVEFAWQVPVSLKYRDGQGKWLLRQALYQHIPRNLMDRPKMGFSVPVAEWLRGPLRDWAEQLLSPDRLVADGLLKAARVRSLWEAHLSGNDAGQHALWNILMFQAWHGETHSALSEFVQGDS
jgi:asparagine synthase (glutamine-hydrolysing)